jgi:hypothetical protein
MGRVGNVSCEDCVANTEDDIDWSRDEDGVEPSKKSPGEAEQSLVLLVDSLRRAL